MKSSPKAGGYPSLRLDSEERPVISSYDTEISGGTFVDMIKLSRFDGLGWQTEIVDTQGPAGYTSLGLDARAAPTLPTTPCTRPMR